MNNGSTSTEARLRQAFHSNPVGRRVILPDGSLAIVQRVHDTDTGKLYRVRGIDSRGRARSLLGISCWYSQQELRLPYFEADIAGA